MIVVWCKQSRSVPEVHAVYKLIGMVADLAVIHDLRFKTCLFTLST